MQTHNKLALFSSLLMATAWMGCSQQSSSEEAAAPAAEPSAEAVIVLAKADAMDGTEDHVVSKCLTCSLGMEGKPEYSSTFGVYELHLCSESCKKRFEAGPEKAVLAVKLPEPTQ